MANLEREIKLRFASTGAARDAVLGTGAKAIRERRLQDDYVFDWPDARLRDAGHLLRVRQEGGTTTFTFKGPPQGTGMKVREEIETTASDGDSLRTVLERLGLEVRFHYQKYRQEYEQSGVTLAIDETPVGTFVEIEGDENGIHAIAARMGCGPSDYIVESYRELFVQERGVRGQPATHMVFEPSS